MTRDAALLENHRSGHYGPWERASLSDNWERPGLMKTTTSCKHIQDGTRGPWVLVQMRSISSSSRADLDTETRLCVLCAAEIIVALQVMEAP